MTSKQGVGFAREWATRPIEEYPLVGSRYLDWDTRNLSFPAQEYVAMVPHWEKDTPVELPDWHWPDGQVWIVGNEIGWDFYETAREYADCFTAWYRLLKARNPTWRVFLGALLSADVELPAVKKQYHYRRNAGLEYWRHIVDWLQVKPDGVCQHGYVVEDWLSVPKFQNQIRRYCDALVDCGWRDLPLWITEYGPLWPGSAGANAVCDYLKATTKYLRDARGPERGYPETRELVQAYFWFSLNSRSYPATQLCSRRELNALGKAYAAMEKKEA